MRLNAILNREEESRQQAAYTLPEVMMGILIISILFVTLYAGFTQGFGVVQSSRENLRATQILQQCPELIRLHTWGQLPNGTTIPNPFVTNWTFYPLGGTGNQGVTYTGTLSVMPWAESVDEYAGDVRKVRFSLTWKTGTIQHTRQVDTLVSRYGLHKYYIPGT